MKRILYLLPFVFILLPSLAFAAQDMNLNNYHYIHSNQSGAGQLLSDKSNRTVIQGDSVNNNGVIKRITFGSNGRENTRLYLKYSDGSTQDVSGDSVILNQTALSISIVLDKTTNSETYVKVLTVYVDDPDAPEQLAYNYTQNAPTNWGDKPSGPDTGNPGTGSGTPFGTNKFYYVDYKDQYRLDYWSAPSSAAKVKLVFTAASGAVYDREWPIDQVGGTLYLTCKGTYELQFIDSSGSVVSSAAGLQTTQIQRNVCESFPEPVPKDDLNAKVTMPACTDQGSDGLPKVSWDAAPSASSYDIYKDGQKIGSTTDTKYDLPGDGSYSVVGKDSNGNVVGESDVNTPYIGASNNSDADAICQCIKDLEPVLNEIRDNTQAIHQDLQVTNDELKQANGNLKEIIKQLTPTKEYALPTPIVKPDLYKPDDVMPAPYVNNQTSFTDQGDAATPDAMPAAPEPEAWEVDGVKLKPDTPLAPETELTPEPELEPEPEMSVEPELKVDPEMKSDPEQTADPELTADPPLQVVEEDHKLRWKSSEYP